jgi:Protein of unknown function (DUF2587)
MSDAHPNIVEHGEIVAGTPVAPEEPRPEEFIEQPAKVMRVGAMMKSLLDEVRAATLDEPSRDRLRDIYETSLRELGSALSPDLRSELGRLALPFAEDATEPPSSAELRIAQAQLVGWLEGLIQGIQATLFAQQMAAQQQLANMRGQLGPGGPGHGGGAARVAESADGRPGTYL